MRAYVFTNQALAKHAGQFVWLSLDTEKAQNAGFQEKFPVEAWPTLFVIDPEHETATFKWLGGANVGDLEQLLSDAELEMRHGDQSKAGVALAQADAFEAQGKHAEAATAYRDAIAAGGAQWPDGERVMLSLLGVLQETGDNAGCLALVRERLPMSQQLLANKAPGVLERETLVANLAATGLQCALALDPKTQGRDETLHQMETASTQALDYADLNADDRSSLYETLIEARNDQKDEAGAKQLAGKQLAFLEAQAAKAPNPTARAVFDAHRVNAAMALGDPARAIPALEQSEHDFPDDYNPPARLAVIYRELGKYPEALAANDRALAKVYGPRKLRVYDVRLTIYDKMGDKAHARSTLDEAIAYARALPVGQRNEKAIARLEAARAKLSN
jgi:tetratricopeptide (TPR) repeat protein